MSAGGRPWKLAGTCMTQNRHLFFSSPAARTDPNRGKALDYRVIPEKLSRYQRDFLAPNQARDEIKVRRLGYRPCSMPCFDQRNTSCKPFRANANAIKRRLGTPTVDKTTNRRAPLLQSATHLALQQANSLHLSPLTACLTSSDRRRQSAPTLGSRRLVLRRSYA